MTTQEIADEFVVESEWFDVTIGEYRRLKQAIDAYPFRSLSIIMWNATLARESWIVC